MPILTHCSIIGDYCPRTDIGSCDDCPLFLLFQQYRLDSQEMQAGNKPDLQSGKGGEDV